MFQDDIESWLHGREKEGLLRSLRDIAGRRAGRVKLAGRWCHDLSSNDYIGFSGHPRLVWAGIRSLLTEGTGSSASRLLSGDLHCHHSLEREIARLKRKEAALVFGSGFLLNTGVFQALCSRDDLVLADRLVHASIIDGILLSRAEFLRFEHNDPDDLERLLKERRAARRNCFIVTESVFSMDGDLAPLERFVRLKEAYGATLFVDEAHATGILGPGGAGLVEELGLSSRVDLVMGTFGKALGSYGAFIAADRPVADLLVNRCRSFIFSTALPPAVTAVSLEAVRLLGSTGGRRTKVLALADRLRAGIRRKGFQTGGETQIVPLIVGSAERAVELSLRLIGNGYFCLPVRPPTVPEGTSRLRLSLTWWHSEAVVDGLLKLL